MPVWDKLVAERCSEPLHPGALEISHGDRAGGQRDVALSTTLIRHVKRINPNCRVTFATRKANISLIQLCPGVDEIVELAFVPRLPGGHDWNQWSRRQELAIMPQSGRRSLRHFFSRRCRFTGTAWPQHFGIDLAVSRCDRWDAAGAATSLLEAPTGGNIAADTVERSLTTRAQISLAARSVTRLTQGAALVKAIRHLAGSGIKQYFGIFRVCPI